MDTTIVSSANVYLPPFDLVRRSLDIHAVRGELTASLPYDDFVKLVKQLIGGIHVDEAWYLSRYPDVADGIARGIVRSAREHFVQDGYFEGRLPFELRVDEGWYLSRYPDVAEGVERGEFESGRDHFNKLGYMEGREPFPV
ncbi:hypothetical protein [Acidisphaera rubrifaciens]|uniref:hypothetical protein n=1 Tax=Acidisphaera rubrifaciens TaxID=50715 RepID=UPI00130D85FD|nr:hypothetical protein [Acidisphaera rubrifaciens]